MDDPALRAALRRELERLWPPSREVRRSVEVSGLMQDVASHGPWGNERVFAIIMDAIVQGILLPAKREAIDQPRGSRDFGFPWLTISEQGSQWIQNTRDQPDPYEAESLLTPLRTRGVANPVVEAYVSEAVRTFKSFAFVATCVLLGVAAEAISEDLYDAFASHLNPAIATKFHSALQAKRMSAEGRWEAFQSRIVQHSGCLGDELRRRFENVFIPHLKLFKQTRDDAAHRRPTLVDRAGALAALYAVPPFAVTAADVLDALARPCVTP